jgi:hypothetical protein
MQPSAFTRYKYSGEYYKFVSEKIGDTLNTKYYFVNNIALRFGINSNNQSVIRCDQPLPIGSLIANIKDADGNLILDDMVWQVSLLQPVVNAFGTIESYSMKVVKYQGIL